MKIALYIGAIVVGMATIMASTLLNKQDYYDIEDAVERLSAQDFKWSLTTMTGWEQDAVVRDYQRRGFKLKCYGNLRVEEKITKDEDYQCYAVIKSAYNIPAKMVTFGFRGQKLRVVRLEFREKTYDDLQQYLHNQLKRYPRLDKQQNFDFGVDVYGKQLMVWRTRYGYVTTSEFTPGQSNIVLWTAS